MSYATFEDEEAQLPAAPKRTCWTRRIFSVALVVGLVCAAASAMGQATPLELVKRASPHVCYLGGRGCYCGYASAADPEAHCKAAHGDCDERR